MKRPSQNTMIITDLQRGKKLTGLQALFEYGCLHLPSRISELRRKGHSIRRQMIKTVSGKRVAQYFMTADDLDHMPADKSASDFRPAHLSLVDHCRQHEGPSS